MHKRALPRSRKSLGGGVAGNYLGQLPLKRRSGPSLFWMFSGVLAILALNLVFVFRHHGMYWLLPVGVPSLVLLGGVILFYSRLLMHLQRTLAVAAGRLNTAFLLFFLCLVGFVILYFTLLAWPMGKIIVAWAQDSQAVEYRRWSLDLAALHSLLFWVWVTFRTS